MRGLKYTDSKGYSVQKDIETADAYGGVPGFSECSLILEPEESDKDRQYRIYLAGILPNLENVRACLVSQCVRIFEHNFAEGKAKKRKHTDVW